ncbi:MAG: hypothetical protein ABEJ82_07160 [Haloplanus sp.]
MAPDATVADGQEFEVMASVDDSARTSQFVIADVSRDDAWVSVPLADASTLDAWR